MADHMAPGQNPGRFSGKDVNSTLRFYVLSCGAEYRNLQVLKPGTMVRCSKHPTVTHKVVKKLRLTIKLGA
jgi:hypothetical protein